jgi:hypothetical protein
VANLWRDLGCGERRPVSANPQPSGYERATLPEIINKYRSFRARSLTNVRVWLRRFIGYLLVGLEPGLASAIANRPMIPQVLGSRAGTVIFYGLSLINYPAERRWHESALEAER